MKNTALLILSLALGLTGTLISKAFSKRHGASDTDCLRYNALSSFTAMTVLLAAMIFSTGLKFLSRYTVGLALLYGTITALSAFFGILALRYGPVSYTAVLSSSSMIIPALSGMIFWQESISGLQWIGILLMLLSFLFAVNRGGSEDQGRSKKWFLCCSAAALCSGLIGILQKVHQSSAYAAELNGFLVIAFAFSALVSSGRSLWHQRIKGKPAKTSFTSLLLFAGGSGLCSAACNRINLYLSGALPSIVFFPIVNGVGLLLSISAGIFLLKERFTRRQTLGMAIGATAVVLLCNIF